MQAIVLSRYGEPDVLRLEEMPVPTPGATDVLVRVHASAINDFDWAYLRGRPYAYRLMFGLIRPRVRVLGAELSGVVEASGGSVTRFRPGDRVYGDVSGVGFGGFAEYACVPERALTAMPAGMSFEQAAALPHAGMLAVQGLVDVGGLRPGERVLINGAGGGVGTLAVQIAKQFGAEVTGVDRGVKLPALTALGFDHVIDYEREDFTRTGRRYDLILDARTTRGPSRYLAALAPGGRYVTVGGNLGRVIQVAATGPLLAKLTGRRLRVVALRPNKDLDYVNGLFTRQQLVCVVDSRYALPDVPAAFRRFGAAEHIGKIIVTVP
jgi:NADPH:quinone reductase-like Zn-dependent oxidoreductase